MSDTSTRDNSRDNAMSMAALSSERIEPDDNAWTRRLVLFLRIMAVISIAKGLYHWAQVTGFIGGSAMRPTPISDKEVANILHQVQEGVEKPKPKVLFEVGESVRVTEGPFTDFNGNVEEVNYEKSKIRVSVLIFGRATPVELDFGQVEKA